MLIRHTKTVATGALAVVLAACSTQIPDGKTGSPTPAPAATAAPATHAEAPAAKPAASAESAATQPSDAPAPPDASPVGGPSVPAADAATPATAAVGPSAAPAAASLTSAASTPGERAPAPEPAYREITLPTGTSLTIDLRTAVASDTSHVEDHVRATLRQPVMARGVEVLPAGTVLAGHVTEAERPGRVKGRARVGFRFTSLDLPGEGGRTAIRTAAIVREAQATKKQDATKIGGGAAGGAVIGAILGGAGGAAKGAAIGGAGGTGVVLATRGKEVHVPAGTNLIVRLQAPVTIRVRR
jgi:hypothetical protein